MAHLKTKSTPASRYSILPGADGCDETFDIVVTATGRRIAAVCFWDARDEARADARRLVRAFNTIAAVNPQFYPDEFLAEYGHVAITWVTDDVMSVRPDLNDEQSWHVLEQCRRVHDCNNGFTWDLIECIAEQLYPEPTHSEGAGQ